MICAIAYSPCLRVYTFLSLKNDVGDTMLSFRRRVPVFGVRNTSATSSAFARLCYPQPFVAEPERFLMSPARPFLSSSSQLCWVFCLILSLSQPSNKPIPETLLSGMH